jgi:outer membrane immunogenic protein
MNNYVLGGLAILVVAGSMPASAADMPIKAPIAKVAVADPWSGFYVGGNVGYSWGPWSSSNTTGATNFFNGAAFVNSASPHVNGWIAGGQFGYNWQRQNLVFGIEGDIQWSGEKASNGGSQTVSVPFLDGSLSFARTATNEWRLNWFSTLRARAGYLIDPQSLLYVTGGLALGSAKYSYSAVTTASLINNVGVTVLSVTDVTTLSETKTRVGWALGGGFERKLMMNWTAKLEYLYVDLGSYTFLVTGAAPGTGFETRVTLRDHIVRLGVNYHF